MTPQVVDTREERDDNLPPTVEIPAVNGNGLRIAKATQEPNLPLFAQNDTQIGFVDEPRKAWNRLTSWWPARSSGWRRSLLSSGRSWRVNGTRPTTFQRKTSASPSAGTGLPSTGSCPFSGKAKEKVGQFRAPNLDCGSSHGLDIDGGVIGASRPTKNEGRT
jgi:hypothetical protein